MVKSFILCCLFFAIAQGSFYLYGISHDETSTCDSTITSFEGGMTVYISATDFDTTITEAYLMINGVRFSAEEVSMEVDTKTGKLKFVTPKYSLFNLTLAYDPDAEEQTFVVYFLKNYYATAYTCKSSSISCCHLTYKKSYTPTVTAITPRISSAKEGQTVVFSIMPENSKNMKLSDETLVQKIALNHGTCDFTSYLTSSSYFSSNKGNSVKCDYYGVTSQVTSELSVNLVTGYSSFSPLATNYFYDREEYKLKVLPYIESISQHSGSKMGGQQILIEGFGFSPTFENNVITIEDVQCEVIESTKNTITCETGKKPTTSDTNDYFPGSPGLMRKIYNSVTSSIDDFMASTKYGNDEYSSSEIILYLGTTSTSTNKMERIEGFIHVPKNGDYKFAISSADEAQLYLSTSRDPAEKTKIITIDESHTVTYENDFYSYTQQFSDAITLNEGNYYYIEIFHKLSKSSNHLKVAIEVPNYDNSHPLSKRSLQKVELNSKPIRETHIITVTSPPVENPDDPQVYQWVYNLDYKNYVETVETAEIPIRATASEITTAFAHTNMTKLNYEFSLVAYDSSDAVLDLAVIDLKTSEDIGKLEYTLKFDIYHADSTAYFEEVTVSIPDGSSLSPSIFGMSDGTPFTTKLTGYFSLNVTHPTYGELAFPTISIGEYPEYVLKQIEEEVPLMKGNLLVGRDLTYSSYDALIYYFEFIGFNDDIEVMELITEIDEIQTFSFGGSENYIEEVTILQHPANEIFLKEITYDFLNTKHSSTQLILEMNGLPAVCYDCEYAYTDSQSKITDFALVGDTLTIDGAAFTEADLEINYILFANGDCSSATITETQITCTVVEKVGGDHKPIINTNIGNLQYDSSIESKIITITPTITSISPDSDIYPGGGVELTLTGTGFPITLESDDVVYSVILEGKELEVLTTSNTQMVVETDEVDATNANLDLTLTINEKEVTYSIGIGDYSGVSVTNIEPNSANPVDKTKIVLTIDQLTDDANTLVLNDFYVILSGDAGTQIMNPLNIDVLSTSKIELTVRFSGAEKGQYDVKVNYKDSGYLPGQKSFMVESKITNITPVAGSILGGMDIAIEGVNFCSTVDDNIVLVDETICEIYSDTFTTSHIDCYLPPSSGITSGATIDNVEDLVYVVEVLLKITDVSDCEFLVEDEESCEITLTREYTPVIRESSIQSGSPDYLLLEGTNFELVEDSVDVINPIIGDYAQTVTSKTSTQIVLEFTKIPYSGSVPLDVVFEGIGSAFFTEGNEITIPISFEKIKESKETGSKGGSLLKLEVYGFAEEEDDIAIYIKNNIPLCRKIETHFYEVLCYTDYDLDLSASGDNTITILLNEVLYQCSSSTASECHYDVADSKTPIVSDVSHLGTNADQNYEVEFTLSANPESCTNWKMELEDLETVDAVASSANVYVGAFTSINPTTYNLLIYCADTNEYALYANEEDRTITFELSITNSMGNVEVSFAGGKLYSIQSSVVSSDNEDIEFTVCDQDCPVISNEDHTISCKLPVLIHNNLVENYPGLYNELVYVDIGIPFADNEEYEAYPFDGDFTTQYQSENTQCYFGIELPSDYLAIVTEVRIYMREISNYRTFSDTKIQASADGITYTDLYEFVDNIDEGWNYYKVNTEGSVYKFFRYYGNGESSDSCDIDEIAFYGVYYVDVSSSNEKTCDMVVTINGNSETYTNAVTYKESLTSYITSFDPQTSSSAGGEEITFTGVNLESDSSKLTIELNGIGCSTFTGMSSTGVSCTTEKRTEVNDWSISFYSSDKGEAFYPIESKFYFIDLWSDVKTWGGDYYPIAGDVIYIPTGQVLVLDIDETPRINTLNIDGVFMIQDYEDEEHHTYLNINNIMVNPGGLFQVGTEDIPYKSKLTITFYGDGNSANLPLFGNKGLFNYYGTIDIHGVMRSPAWSFMTETAYPGDDYILVETVDGFDWKAGENIFIHPSGYSLYEAEPRTITEVEIVDSSTAKLYLNQTLLYTHVAVEDVVEGKKVSVRAEVGMLTRNILLQGDPTWTPYYEIGCQIRLQGRGYNDVIGRFSAMEMYNTGQGYKIEKFSIYFEKVGIVDKSYVKGCSFHHSYNRVIGCRDVSYLTVDNNVIFETRGFAMSVHQGLENHVTFSNNCITKIREAWGTTSMDHQPGSFLVLSTQNSWINNHCSGARDWNWYWCALGRSTPTTCPSQTRVLAFDDNVGHTSGNGYYQDCTIRPVKYPCRSYKNETNKEDIFFHNPPDTYKARNFLGYKNSNGIGQFLIGAIQWINATLVDNNIGYYLDESGFAPEPYSTIQDSLIMDHFIGDVRASIGVTTPRSENFMVINNTFVGYTHVNSTALLSCAACNNYYLGGNMVKFFNNTFIDVYRRIEWNWPKKAIYVDLDGTLTGIPMGTAIHYWKHLDVPECETVSRASHYYDGLLCDETAQLHTIEIYDLEPLIFKIKYYNMYVANANMTYPDKNVTWASSETGTDVDTDADWSNIGYAIYGADPFFPLQGYTIPFVLGYKYFLILKYDYEAFNIMFYRIWGEQNKSISWTIHYNERRDAMFLNITDNTTLSCKNTTTWNDFYKETEAGTYLQDRDNKEFSVLLHNRDPYRSDLLFDTIQCIGGCAPTVPEKDYEDFTRLWSNVTQWPDERLPEEGENVHIPSNWQLELDMDTPILKLLNITGRLFFGRNRESTVLTARSIHIINGELEIGTVDEPYDKKATIRLFGSKFDMLFDGIYGLSNTLLNEGRLTMVGNKLNYVPTILTTNAAAGATSIFVETLLEDWEAGDEIMIAASSFLSTEIERKVISSYNSDTGEIVLTTALEYDHDCLTTKSNTYNIRDLSTVVVNTNRNIIVEGTEDWGATIMARDWIQDDDILRAGYIYLDRINMQYAGHNDSALLLEKYNFFEKEDWEYGIIKNSIFDHLAGGGVNFLNSTNITMTNNIVVEPRFYGFDILNCTNITLDSNNVMSVVDERDVIIPGGTHLEYIYPSFAYEVCTNTICYGVKIINNIGSARYIAFTMKGDDCDQNNVEVYMENNYAHSSMIGFLLNTQNHNQDYSEKIARKKCTYATSFTAYKCWKYGLISYFNALITEVSDITTVDCRHGIFILNSGFYNGKDLTLDGVSYESLQTHYLTIKNSLFIGELTPSTSCYQDVDLNLYSEFNFGSVPLKKSGLLLGSAHTHSKNFPPYSHDFTAMDGTYNRQSKLPEWDVKNANALPNIEANVIGSTFLNFVTKHSSCIIQQYAIMSNMNETDYTPTHYFSDATFANVDLQSVVYLYPQNPYFIGAYTCGQFLCTGPTNNFLHFDPPIELDNIRFNSIISNNPSVSQYFRNCNPVSSWNAYYCDNDHIGMLMFESLANNEVLIGDVVSAPVFITRDEDGFNNTLNNEQNIFYCHDDPDNNKIYEKIPHIIMRHNRFPAIIETDQQYKIVCRGTVPDVFQFQMFTPSNLNNLYDNTIIRLAYNRTISVHLYVETERIEAYYDYSQELTQHGENKWYYRNNTIEFLIRDTNVYGKIVLLEVDAVFLTLRLSIGVDEFYISGGVGKVVDRISATLGVHSSRLRVVGVSEGSTITCVVIDAASSEVGSPENIAELKQISTDVDASIQNKSLTFEDWDILEYQVELALVVDDETDTETQITEQDENLSGREIALIVIIAATSVATIVASILIACKHYQKNQIKRNIKLNEKSELEAKSLTKNMVIPKGKQLPEYFNTSSGIMLAANSSSPPVQSPNKTALYPSEK